MYSVVDTIFLVSHQNHSNHGTASSSAAESTMASTAAAAVETAATARIHPTNTSNTSEEERQPSQSNTTNSSSPLRVLGIAMVVDVLGKGPRTVLRYPTSGDDRDDLFFKLSGRQMAKLFRPKPALCGQPMTLSVGGTVFCCCAVLMEDLDACEEEVFATAMAAATGGGTLPPPVSSSSSSSVPAPDQSQGQTPEPPPPTTTAANHLVLFSVIVALAPPLRTSTIPFGSWMEPKEPVKQRISHTATTTGSSATTPTKAVEGARKASATFLSVRRVHVSLARLCRILEREERRCRYVSTQANAFQRIRQDIQAGKTRAAARLVDEGGSSTSLADVITKPKAPTTTGGGTGTLEGDGAACNTSNNSPQVEHTAAPQPSNVISTPAVALTGPLQQHSDVQGTSLNRHNRLNSGSTGSFALMSSDLQQQQDVFDVKNKHDEMEQDIWETIMAAPPTFATIHDIQVPHHGNLARELLQVYHALARVDHGFAQTPENVLSGRDSVVYINRHLAIAIEAVSPGRRSNIPYNQHLLPTTTTTIMNGSDVIGFGHSGWIRPYLTLFFPGVSPRQLLDTMSESSTSMDSRYVSPRRMQQLLQWTNPKKTMVDIAVDSGLSLHSTIEIASYLVEQGVCLALPILSQNSRLTCNCRTGKIRESALAFSQDFGNAVNLFCLVSFLTEAGRTLGEAMISLITSTHPRIALVRESLLITLPHGRRTRDEVIDNPNNDNRIDSLYIGLPSTDEVDAQAAAGAATAAELEDLLYQMVVWLCSHEILAHLQEYLVGTEDPSDGNAHEEQPIGNSKERLATLLAEDISTYNALWRAECLTGNVSIAACSWKMGINSAELIAFIARHPDVRCVVRAPIQGDDWNAIP